MPLTPADLTDALRTVLDPDIRKDLVTLGMVKETRVDGDRAAVTVELTTPACPMKDKIRGDIEAAIEAKAKERGAPYAGVEVTFTADVRRANEKTRDGANPLPVALARMGARTGYLDGDIYGPSAPTMLGLEEEPTQARGNMLLPFEVHGIKAMTIGKLVDADKPLIWRGPMAHGAFKQLATQTEWGELDYQIIDLPPGTGDVPLTLSQLLPLSGAVIVCTPQQVAQDDARRAAKMFEQLGVPVLGVVENMSYFVDDTGREHDLFGRGGAEIMAHSMGLHFLGAIAIRTALRVHSDRGTPLANWNDARLGAELDAVAKSVAQRLSTLSMLGQFKQPTISVH
jgi:ATP-binding protein involved in chromosome partitioning